MYLQELAAISHMIALVDLAMITTNKKKQSLRLLTLRSLVCRRGRMPLKLKYTKASALLNFMLTSMIPHAKQRARTRAQAVRTMEKA